MSITISGNGVITGATTSYSFDQSVSIGGTLTYEDVTNIDSVGVITARSGIQVTGGSIGIGTDTPGALLSIESTAPNAARLRIGFDSPRYYDIFRGSTSNSGYLNFYGSQTGFTGYIFDGVDGERMRIHTSGNIGIGTDNPTGILHVNGSANDESRIAITTPSRSLTRIGYFGLEKFGIDAQDGFQVRDANSSYATRLLIDSSGKVGINETTPSAILDVKGTVSAGGGNNEDLQEWNIGSDNVKAEIKYIDTAANRGMLFGTTTDHILAFQVNNAERMRIDSDGHVERNGVKDIYQSFFITGNQSYDWDFTVPAEGAYGNSFYLVAGFNHYYTTAYGAHRVAWFSARSTNVSAMIDQNQTHSQSGGWTVSKPNSTTFRVTKTAGSLDAPGYGFFQLKFNNF